jgi:hypothetical protein
MDSIEGSRQAVSAAAKDRSARASAVLCGFAGGIGNDKHFITGRCGDMHFPEAAKSTTLYATFSYESLWAENQDSCHSCHQREPDDMHFLPIVAKVPKSMYRMMLQIEPFSEIGG